MTEPIHPEDSLQTDPPGTDLEQLMRPLYREHDEPRDGFEPVPVWMVAIFGVLLFWGGWYIATNSGGYSTNAYDRPQPQTASLEKVSLTYEQSLEKGRQLFTSCALCHQAEGGGVTGSYPPLKDSEWLHGDQFSVDRLIAIVLYGVRGEWTVKGEKWNTMMPGHGSQLKDAEIAAVLTYVLGTWGNTSLLVQPEDVKKVRQLFPARLTNSTQPLTLAEVQKLPTKQP